ncbi:MAG: pseudouridine synthase [Bacilli bacterium]|nr:pseudouridine synthase [Bacilli bacterium]
MERLQKVIAQAGITSRRKAEELILENRVSVNDIVVNSMGYKVSRSDIIKVDNIIIEKQELKYYVLNKPRYIISSTTDDKNRNTIISFLPNELKKYNLFPIGRLDYDTKGVILLTNDGELSNLLIGPNSNVEKEYLVRTTGIPSKETLKKIANGVDIGGYTTKKCKVKIDSIDNINNSASINIIIEEGKYHQIKKMFEVVGHKVKRLSRIRFGCIKIDNIKEGEVRELSFHEVKQLYSLNNNKQ